MQSPTLSIVIPVRMDSADRLDNLLAVLGHVDGFGVPVLLLEADGAPRLTPHLSAFSHVSYEFVEDATEPFHRTRYINRLLRRTRSDIAAVWDADMFVPQAQVEQAVHLMTDTGATLVYPFDGRVFMLPPDLTRTLRREGISLSRLRHLNLTPLLGRRSCGGIHMVWRERYLALGGENEKYVGWGPEDAERLRRVMIAGQWAEWLPQGAAYHLDHARNAAQQSLNCPALVRMRREFVRECSMTRPEMLHYIQTELLPTS